MKKLIDGSKILGLADAEKLFQTYRNILVHGKSKGQKSLSTLEFIIMLLGAGGKPIYGNTRFQKESFIVYNEYISKRTEVMIENPNFIPFHLGPYSFKLAELMSLLTITGYVKHQGKINTNSQAYYLTPSGIQLFNKLKSSNEVLIEKIAKARRNLDEFDIKGLLKYVYNKPEYKSYTKYSRVKKKYYDGITWGRQRA